MVSAWDSVFYPKKQPHVTEDCTFLNSLATPVNAHNVTWCFTTFISHRCPAVSAGWLTGTNLFSTVLFVTWVPFLVDSFLPALLN